MLRVVRVAAALPAVVVGIAIALTLTVFNGAEREQRAWSWGAEVVYLTLLAIWCLGWIVFASPQDRRSERWGRGAQVALLLVAVTGWLIVLGEALQHPK